MELHVSLDGPGDRAARIYRQIRDAIVDGLLRPGERLPATRDLARQVGVGRNTVAVAYERLTAEGLLVARVGSGTFVTATPPKATTTPIGRRGTRGQSGDLRPRQLWTSLTETPPIPPAEPAVAAAEPETSRPRPAEPATTIVTGTEAEAPPPQPAELTATEAEAPPPQPAELTGTEAEASRAQPVELTATVVATAETSPSRPGELAAPVIAGAETSSVSPDQARATLVVAAQPPADQRGASLIAAALYDFRVGTPDPALFPMATWRRLVGTQLRTTKITGGYGDPAGHPALRAAIARYVGVSRAVRATADDVVVTNGAQQALDLVARILITPGDVVAVEEPGYPPARQLFRSLGARVVPVPVDGDGIDVQGLPSQARLVYVTPSHQFPLGTPMSLARRTALLAWAATHDAAILEDDYDTEYRFTDRPLEPLHALDRTGRVIYVGTFSKTLLPMLRAGFLVAPPGLRPALVAARQLSDWQGDLVTQAALAAFIDSGELHRHIRRATKVYAARHFSLVRAVSAELVRWLDLVPSAAGLHVAATLRAGCSFDAARALDYRIVVERLEGYCALNYQQFGNQQSGLVLGYGGIALDRIEPGVRLLARCLSD